MDDSLRSVEGHGIDHRVPGPPRNVAQLLAEGVLLLPHLVILLVRLMRDPLVPRSRKMVVMFAIAYLASPIDLVPDFVPLVGSVDDLVFVGFAVNHLMNGAPDFVQRGYWEGSEDALDLVRALAEWGSEMVPRPLRRLLGAG